MKSQQSQWTWLYSSIAGYHVAAAIVLVASLGATAAVVQGVTSRDATATTSSSSVSGYTLLPPGEGVDESSGAANGIALPPIEQSHRNSSNSSSSRKQQPTFVLRRRIFVWLRQISLAALSCAVATRLYQCVLAVHQQQQWQRVDALVDCIAQLCWLLGMAALLLLDDISNLQHQRSRMRLWLPIYVLISANFVVEVAASNESLLLLCFALSLLLLLLAIVAVYSDTACCPQQHPPTAEFSCGLLSALSFMHLNAVLIQPAMRKVSLEFEDVPLLSDCDSTLPLWQHFTHILQQSVHNNNNNSSSSYSSNNSSSSDRSSSSRSKTRSGMKPSEMYAAIDHQQQQQQQQQGRLGLFYKLWRLVFSEWLAQGCFQLLSSCVTFIAPLALECILVHVGNATTTDTATDAGDTPPTDTTATDAAAVHPLLPVSIEVAVALLFLGPLVKGITDGQNFVRGRHVGVRVKAVLIAAIYDKALSVDLAYNEESTGQLNNLISVDVDAIQDFCAYSHFLWSTPLELLLSSALLFCVLGKAMIGGLAVLLLAFWFGMTVSRVMKRLQEQLLRDTDSRMSIINEVLNSIRVIKFNAWESKFNAKISSARSKELHSLFQRSVADAVLNVTWEIVPVLVSAASFILQVHVLQLQLSPAVGFTSLTLFNLMRWPLNALPEMINYFVRTSASLGRIEKFLLVRDVHGLPMMLQSVDSAVIGSSGGSKGSKGNSSSKGSKAAASKIAARLAQMQQRSSHETAATGTATAIKTTGNKQNRKSVRFADTAVADAVSATTATTTATTAAVSLKKMTFGWRIGKQQLNSVADTDQYNNSNNNSISSSVASIKSRAHWQLRLFSDCKSPLLCCSRCRDNSTANEFNSTTEEFELNNNFSSSSSGSNSSSDGLELSYCSSAAGRFCGCFYRHNSGYRSMRKLRYPTSVNRTNHCCCFPWNSAADSSDINQKLLPSTDVVDPFGPVQVRGRQEQRQQQFLTVMRDATVSIPTGALAVVAGPTGSGKSSLLQCALLGEGDVLSGSSEVIGSVSYAPQTAWIQNATLRDNILFGRPYDKARYDAVVFACALQSDVKLLPLGDETEIGEKGVNLSGGQQQRVSLARAAYADSDVILLDDPLSAVDTMVGEHIFNELIVKFLCNRTRILVTHNLPLAIPAADIVLYIDTAATTTNASTTATSIGSGSTITAATTSVAGSADDAVVGSNAYSRLVACGPPQQMRAALTNAAVVTNATTVVNNATAGTQFNSKPAAINTFAEMLLAVIDSSAVSNNTSAATAVGVTSSVGLLRSAENCSYNALSEYNDGFTAAPAAKNSYNNSQPAAVKAKATATNKSSSSGGSDGNRGAKADATTTTATTTTTAAAVDTDGGRITTLETKSVGIISWRVYWFYMKQGGGVLAIVALLIGCTATAAAWLLYGLALGRWMETLTRQDEQQQQQQKAFLFFWLSAIAVVAAFLFRIIAKTVTLLRSSQRIHWQLTRAVMCAPCWWFDATPIGRVINRFSQDVSTIDSKVPHHLYGFADCIVETSQIIGVIAYTLPLLLLPFAPVLGFTWWVARQYLHVSRELKRLESIKKSPVFVLFSESLQGLPVIRAFRMQQRFFAQCCERIDNMNSCHLYLWIMNRWLNFRMQLLGAFVAGVVGVAVVLHSSQVGSTLAGIVLIYSMSFCDALTWLARAHADCQMDMNSIERIEEYSQLESEDYKNDPLAKSNVDDSDHPPATAAAVATSTAAGGDIEMAVAVGEHSVVAAAPAVYFPIDTIAAHDDFDSYCRSSRAVIEEGAAAVSKWPTAGHLSFQNVCLKYKSSSQLVLKDVSFTVPAGCKCGVVGRTGAGKSSLIAALFRIVEPLKQQPQQQQHQTGSCIFVDGVDILQLPLQQVRRNIAIVPQEPTLFRGSVRFNLDPFRQYSDADCWTALRKAHLAEHVLRMQSSPSTESQQQQQQQHQQQQQQQQQLSSVITSATASTAAAAADPSLDDKHVTEGGGNFSAGQRQLLCLARAILQQAPLLVLDECTASVDHETDALIQETVRNELRSCTVLCIAHRLNTVAYYDRVLVMDGGAVAEFGAPYELLQQQQKQQQQGVGLFRQMCETSGDFEQLFATAKQSFEQHKLVANTEARNTFK